MCLFDYAYTLSPPSSLQLQTIQNVIVRYIRYFSMAGSSVEDGVYIGPLMLVYSKMKEACQVLFHSDVCANQQKGNS